MFNKRPITLATGAAALLALSGAVFLSASDSRAAELVAAPNLAYDLAATASPGDAAETATNDAPAADTAAIDPASVDCMAKVVLHEAGNQPRAGKVAVAQTVVNRLKAGGRFGDSICGVVHQKGQFFRIASFHPRRDTDGWQQAVEVANEVLSGEAEPVAPGAMFFRANYAPANAFFRSRQRVTTVGAHIFYR